MEALQSKRGVLGEGEGEGERERVRYLIDERGTFKVREQES